MCAYSGGSVSYTHLDVYKRQGKHVFINIKGRTNTKIEAELISDTERGTTKQTYTVRVGDKVFQRLQNKYPTSTV